MSRSSVNFRMLRSPATGTHLIEELPGVTQQALRRAFGVGILRTGDDERGYGDEEWVFAPDEGHFGEVYTLYSRWGTYRLGGKGQLEGDDPRQVEDFKDWLFKKIGRVGRRRR